MEEMTQASKQRPRWILFFAWLEENFVEMISIILMIAIAVIMGIQVCARYVFNSSLSWSEELCIYMFIWMGFLSLSYCIRNKSSIKVEMIVDMLPRKLKLSISILENLIMLVFYFYMCFPAFEFVQGVINSGQLSSAMKLPMYYLQVAPLATFILAVLRSAQGIVEAIRLLGKTNQAGQAV